MVAGQRRLNAMLEASLDEYRKKVRPTMGTEAFKRLLTRKTRQAFAGRKVAVRVWRDRLDRMLDRGRLTTLHETRRSSGSENVGLRMEWERSMFGIPFEAPWQDRPVYGYLMRHEPPSYDEISQYGDVVLIMREEVRDRTTALFGDSLGNDRAVPTPVNDPDWRSWDKDAFRRAETLRQELETRSVDNYSYYVEAQIHGGVELHDIEKVVFVQRPDQRRIDKLDRLGIAWEVNPEALQRTTVRDRF
jgi:hypothetical protein